MSSMEPLYIVSTMTNLVKFPDIRIRTKEAFSANRHSVTCPFSTVMDPVMRPSLYSIIASDTPFFSCNSFGRVKNATLPLIALLPIALLPIALVPTMPDGGTSDVGTGDGGNDVGTDDGVLLLLLLIGMAELLLYVGLEFPTIRTW